jgi:hypothetical protein
MQFAQCHYYAVSDARSQEAKDALASLAGDVGRLVRRLAELNAHRRPDMATDDLHEIVIGQVGALEDLPFFGEPPAAWQELYEPWRDALGELEAADAAFLALWRRALERLLPSEADDQEARALVARIEAQRDALSYGKLGELQRLRIQLLPDALASWQQAIDADQAKLPALEKRVDEARRKADEASAALSAVNGHLSYVEQQMQAIGKTILALPEHADKREQVYAAVPALGRPAAPISKVLYPRGLVDGHAQPLSHPETPAHLIRGGSPLE